MGILSRPLIALFAGLLGFVGAAEAAGDNLEVALSRSGYNLLWPTKRCCAFDLRIPNTAFATLTVNRAGGESPVTEKREYRLSPQEMLTIHRAVEENAFFSLPAEICCFAVDGDVYRISVRIGSRSHEVVFGEGASGKQRAELTRVLNVWRAVRATAVIEGENVRLDANAF